MGAACRVVSWNVAFSGRQRAAVQGSFLRSLRPDLVLLQELNPESSAVLEEKAALDWVKYSPEVAAVGLSQGRRRAAAVGGRGVTLLGVLPQGLALPMPEKVHAVTVAISGTEFVAISYHAPPGVSWGYRKVEQALAFVDWLNDVRSPAILGADANTPEIDHPDFTQTRTHWHTGMRRLGGLPGDDLLWGPAKTHRLTDPYRMWLEARPVELSRIRKLHPSGPLAESYWTGKRRQSLGTPRRFDSIWISPEIAVETVTYRQEALELSDHAAILADLRLSASIAIH